jgi:type IV secretion system protein VirB10
LEKVEQPATTAAEPGYVISSGTHIPLSLINSVSTKNAAEGDRVYLESVYPIMTKSRIVIPAGSYVSGTITHVKRAGRVKGRAEFYVRFDSLTLPNGVTRDFHASISNLDGRASETLDREEGKIKGEGNKAGDARTVAESAGAGAGIGGLAGIAGGRPGMGAGIGAGAGAAAGLIGVLLSRGPDAVLARGTGLEMILDRPLQFSDDEIRFDSATLAHRPVNDSNGPLPSVKERRARIPGRGWPF